MIMSDPPSNTVVGATTTHDAQVNQVNQPEDSKRMWSVYNQMKQHQEIATGYMRVRLLSSIENPSLIRPGTLLALRIQARNRK